ncbi:YybH family protein [Pendulispora albinea]|uniref:Nuclear transport factor 2 family protein n=1 Tax=Pendulispora albinea TaxID=2741071 RepID=A0ABZ2LJS1_9BACT
MQDVRKPEDMNEVFIRTFNEGKIDALMELYEPGAVSVAQDGSPLHGLDGIRAELVGLLALGGKMEGKNRYALTFDGVALLSANWTLTAKTPDGAPLVVQGRTTEVIRRQPDGRWLYIIDHPTGA